jgi:dihydrodipicolinate synthase/N-acetylneuraminate lyase
MGLKTIIPVPTLWWLPSEEEIMVAWFDGKINTSTLYEIWQEQLMHGAPDFFHTGTAALLNSFPETIHGILIAGTTGEGSVFGINQFKAIVQSHLKNCPPHLVPYIGILGSDEMVAKQIEEAQALWARNFVFWLNHTGDNRRRFQEAMAALELGSSIWLYNMPTFKPENLDFVRECMGDPRVKWIKDSSGKLVDFQALLWLKKERSDFEIYLGSEPLAAELTKSKYANTDGIIAGNATIDPELLAKYTQNPKAFAEARKELHEKIHKWGNVDEDFYPQWNIRNHIHGIKYSASQSIPGIDHRHVVMYSKRKGLFIPHPPQ